MTPQEARNHLVEALVNLQEEFAGDWQAPTTPIKQAAQSEPNIAVRLSIGEQVFTMVHSLDPELCDTAYLETHFGSVPVRQSGDSYRQLLELNFGWMAVQSRGFGIDKASGDVILTAALPVEQITASYLIGCMDATCGLATAWRAQHSFRIAAPDAQVGATPSHTLDFSARP